jgi:hypothetical protein
LLFCCCIVQVQLIVASLSTWTVVLACIVLVLLTVLLSQKTQTKLIFAVFFSQTGAWSTSSFSVARVELAATSVANLALFAGRPFYCICWRGRYCLHCSLCALGGRDGPTYYSTVDAYNGNTLASHHSDSSRYFSLSQWIPELGPYWLRSLWRDVHLPQRHLATRCTFANSLHFAIRCSLAFIFFLSFSGLNLCHFFFYFAVGNLRWWLPVYRFLHHSH